VWKSLLILSLVLVPLILLAIPVNGATVMMTQNVIINTKYGKLTVLSNSITINSLTVYANGTVYFDLAGNERTQSAYLFTGNSYGNGTFDIRFNLASLPTRVLSVGSAVTTVALLTRVTYTASQTNLLELDFQPLPSIIIANGLVMASSWYVLIFVILGVLFATVMINQLVAIIQQKKPVITPLQALIVGILVIMGYTLLIVIGVMTSGILKGLGS